MDKRIRTYTVTIFGREYVVDAKDRQEARKKAAWEYRKDTQSTLPIVALQSAGRVRCHDNIRSKWDFGEFGRMFERKEVK